MDVNSEKFISLTDIARKKNIKEPRFVIINWLRNRNTIEFLGIWETIHNKNFNRIEFDTNQRRTRINKKYAQKKYVCRHTFINKEILNII